MNAQALAAIEQRLARLEASANGRSIGNGKTPDCRGPKQRVISAARRLRLCAGRK